MRAAPFPLAMACAGLLCGWICVQAAAQAQGGAALVAVVTSDPVSPATRRVRAELEALGVEVIVIRPPAEASDDRAPLERAARNVGAFAAVRIVSAGKGVEVWVADRVTGKTVIRSLLPAESEASGASSAAIGAVELLRASLMELHAPSPHRGDAEATPKIRALALPSSQSPAPPRAPRFSLTGGAGAELGLGGLGVSEQGHVAIWVALAHGFGLRGFGAFTMAAAQTSPREGVVRTSANFFGGGACYDLPLLGGAIVPQLGVGFAGVALDVTGTATPPFTSLHESTLLGGPYGHLGVGWTFLRNLRFRVDAAGIFTTTRPAIEAGTHSSGSFGSPALLLSAGLEVLWSGD